MWEEGRAGPGGSGVKGGGGGLKRILQTIDPLLEKKNPIKSQQKQ